MDFELNPLFYGLLKFKMQRRKTFFNPAPINVEEGKAAALIFLAFLLLQDICSRPTFIASGASRFDVEQGELGDPWYAYALLPTLSLMQTAQSYVYICGIVFRLLAAISSLTLTPRFLDRVVPPDQTFDQHYCGLFRCSFLVSLFYLPRQSVCAFYDRHLHNAMLINRAPLFTRDDGSTREKIPTDWTANESPD